MQPTAEVEAQHAGILVTRKIEAVDINGKAITNGNAAAAKTNAAEVNDLKVGDRVIVEGLQKVKPGAPAVAVPAKAADAPAAAASASAAASAASAH